MYRNNILVKLYYDYNCVSDSHCLPVTHDVILLHFLKQTFPRTYQHNGACVPQHEHAYHNTSVCTTTRACVPQHERVYHNTSVCTTTRACVPQHERVYHNTSVCTTTRACVPQHERVYHNRSVCTTTRACVPQHERVYHNTSVCTTTRACVPQHEHVYHNTSTYNLIENTRVNAVSYDCFQGKLIKLFGKQLITKAKLKLDELPPELLQFPKMQQWLKVVGIRPNTLQVR